MDSIDIIIMILLTLIVICAIATIFTKRLLTAVVIYMSFSVIMSIIWALLQAPDLSITEPAVGAGVTSIFYFVTLEKLKGIEEVLKQDGTI